MEPSIFTHFYSVGIIPVIEIDSPDHAVPLAIALKTGGLPVVETTLRTDAGFEAIRRIARDDAAVAFYSDGRHSSGKDPRSGRIMDGKETDDRRWQIR